MTAWSAKVFKSSICRGVKGTGSRRTMQIAPIARPSRSIGAARTARTPPIRILSRVPVASGSASISGTCTTARSRMALAPTLPRVSGIGPMAPMASSTPGLKLLEATRWSCSPSSRHATQDSPSKRPLALLAMASNTGRTSVGELEMTPRISAVAVCCSSASASRFSRSRTREFSWLRELLAPGSLAPPSLAFTRLPARRIGLSSTAR
jgi:hypothetical protein